MSSIPKEAPASALQQKDVLKDQLVHATISIGSQSMNSSSHIKETEYRSGSVTSEHGAVMIQAQGKDSLQGNLTAIGERIQGKTVTLGADGSVELLAAKNERQSEEDTKQKGWSVGVHVGVTGLSGGEIGAYQGKSEGLTTRTTHTGTTVIGEEKAQITAGKDVSVIGSKIMGDQVALTAGNHLTMTSLQDTEQYQKDSKASGFSIATDKKGLSDVGAYGTTGKTKSKYVSVTDQAGIYAGTEGFQVTVGDTTHLTGAVISSPADKEKNSLTTGTLVMENVYNEADFSDKTVGLNYTWSRRYDELKGKSKEESGLSPAEQTVLNNQYNKMGLLPELSPGSKGEASSVTTSAISDGKIVATKGAVDVSQINRNTAHSLNSLDKIFDKKKVEEKQELAKLFAKNVNEAIHIISKNKGWDDGSPEKIALHTFFAGIEGQLSGNGFSSGALAGGVNELVAHQLLETLGTNHPDLAQMASAALGYATNKLAGKEGLAGAAIAQYGTKWNLELDDHAKKVRQKLYKDLIQDFRKQYKAHLINKDLYSEEEVNKAENDLTYIYYNSREFGLTPMATELLGLFMEPNKYQNIIDHTETLEGDYKLLVLNEQSEINQRLRNDDALNKMLIKEAFEEKIGQAEQPTYVNSRSFYYSGLDAALAFGSAASIVTFAVDGSIIKGKITIIDNWDHDKAEADYGGFIFKDAYL